jgi:hypothetical protein
LADLDAAKTSSQAPPVGLEPTTLRIIGLLLNYVAGLPLIGTVLVLFGRVIFWIGVAVLVIQLIIALVKGLP